MNNRKVGILLMIVSGVIYTLERGFSMLSASIVKAGFFSGGMTGEVPGVEASGFLDNLFVPLLLFAGIGLIMYSFVSNTHKKQ